VANEVEKRVVLNLDYCVECLACSAACFYGHKGRATVQHGETAEAVIPMLCRQCEDPACVAVCQAGAMERDEYGIARRQVALCRGCGSCVRACPFGVLNPDLTLHQVDKCDLCRDKVVAGGEPRCVSVCPTGALQFQKVEEMEEEGVLILGGRVSGKHPVKRR